MSEFFIPFSHEFMQKAIFISALVGLLSGVLSAFLVLRGWALIGDALSHSIVPGVSCAYLLGLPFALGAFIAGGLAAAAMFFLNHTTNLRQDAIIGLVFTSFFALGLFIASLAPIAVDISTIIFGNILAISTADSLQIGVIALISLVVILFKWRDFMLVFFDENFATSIGLNIVSIKIIFFSILTISTISAMLTVGAFLVIALVIMPGAIAYMLCNRFGMLLCLSGIIGLMSCGLGVYLSYFLDILPGGVIIVLQSLLFVITVIFAPYHGIYAKKTQIASTMVQPHVK